MDQNRVRTAQGARRSALCVALMGILFLSACGARIDQTFTFKKNAAWKAEMIIGLPPQGIAYMSSAGQLTRQLDEGVLEMRAAGVDADWRLVQGEEESRYVINASGRGHDTLNEFFFDNRATIEVSDQGRRQIRFAYRLPADFTSADSTTVTLVGGEILESNGQRVNSSTVRWMQPRGVMEATFTERSGLPGGVGLFAGGVVAFLLVVGGFVLKSNGARSATKAQYTTTQAQFCRQCGGPLGPQAKFCPRCGAPHQ